MDGDSSISGAVIRAAIDVHRALGPGLLESAYRTCLVSELRSKGLSVEAEVPLALTFRGKQVSCAYRLDLLVGQSLIVELKAVEVLDALHMAQLLTYLKLSGCPLGLLINFNVPKLKQGIRRVVLTPASPPA